MCTSCEAMIPSPARDWKVSTVTFQFGPYPYRVTGENLNWPVGHMERNFSWSLPAIVDPRYDFTSAVFDDLVHEHLELTGAATTLDGSR